MSTRLTLTTKIPVFCQQDAVLIPDTQSSSHEELASPLPAKVTTSMNFIYQNTCASSSRGETEASARGHGTFAGVDAALYDPSGLISGTAHPENARVRSA